MTGSLESGHYRFESGNDFVIIIHCRSGQIAIIGEVPQIAVDVDATATETRDEGSCSGSHRLRIIHREADELVMIDFIIV